MLQRYKDKEIEITNLALKYQIATKYTSFICNLEYDLYSDTQTSEGNSKEDGS